MIWLLCFALAVKRAGRIQCVYCFSPGGGASGARSGNVCVSVGTAPLTSDATQSPAQSLVPLTLPTSLQPIGAFDLT